MTELQDKEWPEWQGIDIPASDPWFELEIKEAKFGSDEKNIDITNKVRSAAAADRSLKFKADGLGDPHPWHRKSYKMKFYVHKRSEGIRVMEHEMLQIPASPAGMGILVKKAWFGVADETSKCIDITNLARKFVKADGSLKIPGPMMKRYGDPSPGQIKELIVMYEHRPKSECHQNETNGTAISSESPPEIKDITTAVYLERYDEAREKLSALLEQAADPCRKLYIQSHRAWMEFLYLEATGVGYDVAAKEAEKLIQQAESMTSEWWYPGNSTQDVFDQVCNAYAANGRLLKYCSEFGDAVQKSDFGKCLLIWASIKSSWDEIQDVSVPEQMESFSRSEAEFKDCAKFSLLLCNGLQHSLGSFVPVHIEKALFGKTGSRALGFQKLEAVLQCSWTQPVQNSLRILFYNHCFEVFETGWVMGSQCDEFSYHSNKVEQVWKQQDSFCPTRGQVREHKALVKNIQGNTSEAINIMKDLLEESKRAGDLKMQIWRYYGLGQMLFHHVHMEDAKKHLSALVDEDSPLYKEAHILPQREVWLMLASIAAFNGDHEEYKFNLRCMMLNLEPVFEYLHKLGEMWSVRTQPIILMCELFYFNALHFPIVNNGFINFAGSGYVLGHKEGLAALLTKVEAAQKDLEKTGQSSGTPSWLHAEETLSCHLWAGVLNKYLGKLARAEDELEKAVAGAGTGSNPLKDAKHIPAPIHAPFASMELVSVSLMKKDWVVAEARIPKCLRIISDTDATLSSMIPIVDKFWAKTYLQLKLRIAWKMSLRKQGRNPDDESEPEAEGSDAYVAFFGGGKKDKK